MDFTGAKSFIVKYLEQKLPNNLYYHGIHHTLDVLKSVKRISRLEGQNELNIRLVKTAALYHDVGFVTQYNNNEEIGAFFAEKTLPDFGYSQEHIRQIVAMILTTKIKAIPKTNTEKILCDADYDYLGRDDFHIIANNLYNELLEYGYKYSQIEWDNIQLKFLMTHSYYTKTQLNFREKRKQKHINEIESRLNIL